MHSTNDNDEDDDLLIQTLIKYEKEIKKLKSLSKISLNSSLIDLTNDIEYEHIIYELRSCFENTNTAFEVFGQELVNMNISNDLEDLYNIIQPFNLNTIENNIIWPNTITQGPVCDSDQYNMYGGSKNPWLYEKTRDVNKQHSKKFQLDNRIVEYKSTNIKVSSFDLAIKLYKDFINQLVSDCIKPLDSNTKIGMMIDHEFFNYPINLSLINMN